MTQKYSVEFPITGKQVPPPKKKCESDDEDDEEGEEEEDEKVSGREAHIPISILSPLTGAMLGYLSSMTYNFIID